MAKLLPVIVITVPGTPEVGLKVRVDWAWTTDGATKTRLIISTTTTRTGKDLRMFFFMMNLTNYPIQINSLNSIQYRISPWRCKSPEGRVSEGMFAVPA